MGWQTSIAPIKSLDYSRFLQLTLRNYKETYESSYTSVRTFSPNVTKYATVNRYDQVPWKKQIYDDFGVRSRYLGHE